MDDVAQTSASLSAIRRPGFSSGALPAVMLNLVCYKILFLQLEGTREMYFSSISTLLDFLILKCQGMDKTPFDTHPKTMTAAIICFMLFVCSIRVEAEASNRIRVATYFVFLFWSLAMASLVSLVFPDWIRPILYMLCLVPLFLELLRSSYWTIWKMKLQDWLDVRRICIGPRFIINQRRIGFRRPPV